MIFKKYDCGLTNFIFLNILMAIYHLKVKMLSRSEGKSAIAAAAYRSASLLKDERQNLTFDYSKKHGVEYSKIFAPNNAPSWVFDREKLWNQAELSEKRINSQVAREIEVAIPIELSKERGVNLVEDFVVKKLVNLGMIADVNIHLDNPENPHAHILLTTREISSKGFAEKNRSWNSKEKLQEWRRAWAEIANEHLRIAGFEVGIDHRSYKDQEIELTPTTHLGPILHRALQNGNIDKYDHLLQYKKVIASNGTRVVEDPEIALDVLTSQQAVFSETDIYKFANRNSVNEKQFNEVVSAIKHHANTIELAKTDQGKIIYTSRSMIEVEAGLIKAAIDINSSEQHEVAEKYRAQAIHGSWFQKLLTKPKLHLNDGQMKSLDHILSKGDLKIIIGFAGTGKSTLLGVAKKAWEGQGYRVFGTALSGIATQNLQESGIQSRTIDSFLLAVEKNVINLTAQDVLVVDEAGMVNSRRLAELLCVAQTARAKIILLGDPEQLQPIQAGAPFRAIAERVGYSELNEVVRQKHSVMQQASKEFATQRTWQALDKYKKLGVIHEHKTRIDAINSIIVSWSNNRDRSIILAYTRKDVAILNEKARFILKGDNVLKNEQKLLVRNREGEEVTKIFAPNDRIYFIRNDNLLGVKNGSLGKIQSISGDVLTVRLDTGESIVFSLRDYNHIDHGYAATVHKAQGITVDRTYFLADKYLDRHATYVAATRHRDHLEIHYDRETFKYSQDLYRTLCRERIKDMVIDYADVRDLQNILEANEAKNTFEYDKELIEKLSGYFDLRREYDQLVMQKVGVRDQKVLMEYNDKVNALSKKIMKEAKFIANHQQIKKFSQHSGRVSFYDRGGVDKIRERLKSEELSSQDLIAIMQDASSRAKNSIESREQNLEVEREIER